MKNYLKLFFFSFSWILIWIKIYPFPAQDNKVLILPVKNFIHLKSSRNFGKPNLPRMHKNCCILVTHKCVCRSRIALQNNLSISCICIWYVTNRISAAKEIIFWLHDRADKGYVFIVGKTESRWRFDHFLTVKYSEIYICWVIWSDRIQRTSFM